MRIVGLYDIDQDIKVNNLKEVTSAVMYSAPNQYNPNGLFSEEIFGQTEEEQKYRCGYIKLPIHVFNPNVAKNIIVRSGGIIRKLAYGEIRCNLVDGKLIEAEDGKYCGFRDLYNIWDEIDIRKNLNTRNDASLDILIKSPKRLLFVDKLLVLPPAFRPSGMKNGKQVKSELNTIYIKIIGLKSVTSHTTASVHKVDNQIQDALIELYTYINKFVGTKNGYFQKNLLAKNTVGTIRNVISAPSYKSNTPEVGIFRTGYPLMTIVGAFQPFIKFELKQLLSYDHISSIHPNPDEVDRANIENIYDDKMISDLIQIFMRNPGSRFRILYLDPDNKKPIIFNALNLKTNETISRPLTLTDVIYIAAYRSTTVADRHMYTVRYPIGHHLGAFFSKIHVLSTNSTIPVQFQNEVYRTYPLVNPEASHMTVSKSFVDVINMANSRLQNIGGDYDGDTVKSTGIWSDEANAQAEKLMYSKAYCVKPNMDAAFPIEIECLNGLYGLTKME